MHADIVLSIAMYIPVALALAGCYLNSSNAGLTINAAPTPNPATKNPDIKPTKANFKIEETVIYMSPMNVL